MGEREREVKEITEKSVVCRCKKKTKKTIKKQAAAPAAPPPPKKKETNSIPVSAQPLDSLGAEAEGNMPPESILVVQLKEEERKPSPERRLRPRAADLSTQLHSALNTAAPLHNASNTNVSYASLAHRFVFL